ncbi:hypothetical protein E8E95_02120 [Pseudomonas sp. BN414]|uniref:hypothetical protein n=1 Tax=Pseudomonas TaxID=286 RepID=UPI0015B8776E|nr:MULTISPECIES: hypothetical protein [Pseudomonas]MDH4565474.1 hypothetical protein [Pseudomonas sp. BN414]MDH4580799.1 hypothetical protein [Pseudomonas sp. BN415]NWL78028.1 hypothetical protein [Pseudomonas taiwanensis]
MYTAPYYTPRELDPPIRQTLGKLLVHTLAEQAGVDHSGAALARWYEHQCGQGYCEPSEKNWRLFFKGRVLSEHLQAELTVRYPLLREVLSNILWPTLCANARGGESWGALSSELGEELQLDLATSKGIDWLSRCVSLNYLSILFLIIRTKSARYTASRVRASLLFTKYLQVLCVTSPLSYIAGELYQIVDSLIWRQDLYELKNHSDWPHSFEYFHAGVNEYRELIGELTGRGWFDDKGRDLSIFMAMLINHPHDFKELPDLLLHKKPDWIAARIRRHVCALEAWQKEIKSLRWRLEHFRVVESSILVV